MTAIGVGVGVGRGLLASPPDTLPTVLKNLHFLGYSPRLAETYAVNSPVKLFGQPTAAPPTVSAEATLRQTAGGSEYVQFDGIDDYYRLPSSSYTKKTNDVTLFVIGRNWVNIAPVGIRGASGLSLYIQRVIVDSASTIRIFTSQGGAFTSTDTPTPASDTFWFVGVTISPTGRRAVFYNDSVIADTPAYGNVDIKNETLDIMFNFGAGKAIAGDVYAVGYDTTALSDQRMHEIAALRPTS